MDLEPKEFKNVTLYIGGNVVWGYIVRIDAMSARIWVAPYAQHKASVYVEYIAKGKRKPETTVSSGAAYVVVVPTKYAIQPDDLYLPEVDGVSSTRYGVADPRWRTDFDEQLRQANVPILADYRNVGSAVETGEVDAELGHTSKYSSPTPLDRPTDLGNAPDVFDFEEGLRHQAERNFFKRNPGLVKRAKEVYGCACQACGFDFGANYGTLGVDFAEVHHLNPLSERPPEEWMRSIRTNIAEVAILCANCHRMVHQRKPALSIDELKISLNARRNGAKKAH